MHVHTIAPEDATGLVRELYDADLTDDGYVSNISRLYSLRPEVLVAWRNLIRAIREPMDLRRYELATLAAGAALRCRYCVAAHGEVLESEFYDRDQLEAIVRDYRGGGVRPAPAPVS
jgi:AhpD family alkylhydroperoxidase